MKLNEFLNFDSVLNEHHELKSVKKRVLKCK